MSKEPYNRDRIRKELKAVGESARKRFSALHTFFEPRKKEDDAVSIATAGAVALSLVLFAAYLFMIRPPAEFPVGVIVDIEEGSTLDDVAKRLESEQVIRSPLFFKYTVRIFYGGDHRLRAGEYYFLQEASPFYVARMMTAGDYGLVPVSVTIPEGASTFEMAEILDRRLAGFDRVRFIRLASEHEGYLFPDTYFFLPNADEKKIIKQMRGNFDEKIAKLRDDIKRSGRSEEDIVIMASLLEKEARQTQTRRKIAGILWKRLEIDMPLQVDAVFPYIIGKNTFELSLEDLQYDSPYNTYRYPGLPIGPIANPGMDSLHAALNPIDGPYLFYLADNSGVTHYSETFEEHKRKKAIYLN